MAVTRNSKSRALIPARPPLPAKVLAAAQAAAAAYGRAARAPSTWVAYESDWRIFKAWCREVELVALPAEPSTVALFLGSEARRGLAPNTLERRRSAIRLMHVGARVAPPTDALEVTEVMAGIRRTWGRPPNKKAAAVDEVVQRMVETLDLETLRGLRDRALLLVGFGGGLRRSEPVAIRVEHLTWRPEGVEIVIPRSKGDQEAAGQMVTLLRVPDSPYCPVHALQAWLAAAAIDTGPVFRRFYRGDHLNEKNVALSAQSVALLVKALAERVGLDPEQYSGQSLRRGLLTSAARQGANIWKMLQQSRHRSVEVLQEYVEDGARFKDHAAQGLLQRPGRAT